jgi:MFS family permease
MPFPAQRNIHLLYTINFLYGLIFFLPILALYLQQALGSVLEVMTIISIGAITVVVAEVPGGVVADLYGRRRTILLAFSLQAIAVAFLAVGTNFWFFVTYAIINGIGMSLYSGTNTALAYETLQHIGEKNRSKHVIGRMTAMWPLGAALAAFIGGLLAMHSLRLPVLVTILPFVIAVICAAFLVDAPYAKQRKTALLHMKSSATFLLQSRQLILLAAVGLLFFSFAEVAHQLKPIFFDEKGIAVAAFGLFYAAAFGLSSLGSLLSHTISEYLGDKRTLLSCAAFATITLFCSTMAPGYWAGVLVLASSFSWGVQWPVMTHLANEEITSGERATILSIGNLANRLGLAIAAPIFGYLTDLWGIVPTLQLVAALSISVLVAIGAVRTEPQKQRRVASRT